MFDPKKIKKTVSDAEIYSVELQMLMTLELQSLTVKFLIKWSICNYNVWPLGGSRERRVLMERL